jgi:NAD(P)-dependent dehydrogenase (short-subunit alcohol dehydrogenase family)
MASGGSIVTQELAGKIAIITGGAAGIGRAAAELFVAEGARVVIADVDARRGADLAATLGTAARFRRADVSIREEVQNLVDTAVLEFGGLHIMFNNAGVTDNSTGRLLEDDFTQFERVMRVNVLGVMLGTQLAGRYMSQHGGGSIINTASIAGTVAGFGFPIYRAAKAGAVHFTKSAAIELGEYSIRVNCICPGNIPTDMGTYAAPAPGMSPEDAARVRSAIGSVRMARQPLKRQGWPLDIAQLALFLASDRAQQMSGQVLSVDGAATAGDARSLIQDIMQARADALAR